MLFAFISAVFPVFFVAGIGFILAKRTDYFEHPGLSMLSSQIALPALVFYSVVKMQVPPGDLIYLMGVTALCLAIGASLVAIFCKFRNLSPKFFISTLVNPNTGNLGIPIVFALLGPEALAPAIIISTTVSLSHFTLGTTAMSGAYQWRKLLTNMPLIALLSGVLVVFLGIELPKPAFKSLEMISGIALPIMLMLLGRSLARLKVNDASQVMQISLLSIYRPISGFLIAFLVTRFVGLNDLETLSLLIQMSMPVAVMSYILTVRYAGPADLVAALTVTSLPVMLVIVSLIYQYQDLLVL